jgi:prepilin-type N-terminal cleavage/methylation domain-containing protein
MLRPRAGLTLPELLVAMVLLSIVMTGLTTVIMQQQRFYSGTAQLIETRTSVRQVAEILPSELRAISPASGDIYAMTATSIDYRASVGSSVTCLILAPNIVTIPPVSTILQNGSTAWLTPPVAGDSVLIYDQGPLEASADDAWRAYELAAPPSPANICPTYTSNASEAAMGFSITLIGSWSSTIKPGASIRFFRRSRFELYNGSDGLGYLGFSDCLPTRSPACTSPQPVSGPYLPLGGSPEGLTFSYVDSTNTVTTNPLEVARIDVVSRARTRSALRIAGYQSGQYRDSLTFSVATRN